MAGHRLRLALEAVTARPARDDDRDAGQRAADALDTMAQEVLASGHNKPGAHVPPQVSLLMSAETFAGARAARAGRASDPEDGERGAAVTYPPAELEDGTPVPVSELARVLCDCDVTRSAVDAAGLPLDLGRTQRLFTKEQRRAVLARDRECVWPSCQLAARWCQIRHMRWWERDAGPTSIDNAAALCTFDHGEVHARDLAMTRLPGALAGPAHGPPSCWSRW